MNDNVNESSITFSIEFEWTMTKGQYKLEASKLGAKQVVVIAIYKIRYMNHRFNIRLYVLHDFITLTV